MIKLVVFTFASLLFSCGITSSNIKSLVTKKRIWLDPENIPVCFHSSSESVRREIQSMVQEAFSETPLRFRGWESCGRLPHFPQIRISFTDSRTSSSYIGPARRETTMTLSKDYWDRSAVHEFGHAVGLYHEHKRSDGDSCAKELQQSNSNNNSKVEDGDGVTYVGPYDRNSVMNYCNSNRGSSLSPGDIEGIQYLYK